MNLRSKLEAVLFTVGDPTSPQALAESLQVTEQEVHTLTKDLARSYEEQDAGIRVLVSPEGIQLVTASEAAGAVEAFVKFGIREKLTSAAAETLAIIAYRGPISRPGIEAIRGVNSAFTLRLLALRGLVVRAPHPTDRRMFVYEVSAEFLRSLGVTSVGMLPDYAALMGHAGMVKLIADAENSPPVTPRAGPEPTPRRGGGVGAPRHSEDDAATVANNAQDASP